MKRIIYTAVALIICASVFGIADYINAKKQGALVNYTDDVQTNQAVIHEKKTEMNKTAKEEVLTASPNREFKKEMKEKKITKTKVREDMQYSGTVPEIPVTEKTKSLTGLTSKVNTMDILQAKYTDDNKNDSIIPDNKRRVNLEMFSRAPIREKITKSKK